MKVIRLLLLLLHAGIFFLLAGMLLNAYVPPKAFPWLNLLSLGFPVLVTVYLLLTLFWIISWKKRAFVFLLLGLLFFNATLRWINYRPVQQELSDFTVLSFNTRGEKETIVNELKSYLLSQQADVILLQENRGNKIELKGYSRGKAGSLTTLLTRHEIVDEQRISSDAGETGSCGTWTDIRIKGKTYRFVNVYLHPFKFEKSMVTMNGNNKEDEEKIKNIIKRLMPTFKIHQEEVASIRKAVDASPYPVILAGDFNSVPNSYEYYHLGEGLKDAFTESGKGSATSFHDYKFPIRIDYIFASPSMKPLRYNVDRSVRISDHFPVIAGFREE